MCTMLFFIDIKPPVIHNCPHSKIMYTDKGKVTSTVSWLEPTATDNSRETIALSLVEGQMNVPYAIGAHTFKYTAADSAGNKAKPCKFIISVRRMYPYLVSNRRLQCLFPRSWLQIANINFNFNISSVFQFYYKKCQFH